MHVGAAPGLDCTRTEEFSRNSAIGKEFDMKSSSLMVVMFALAVTASLVVAKSILTVTEQSQGAVPAQTRVQVIPTVGYTQPVLVGQRQPPAPAQSGNARLMAEAKMDPASATFDGTWTVLVVHGNKREYVTYSSMRRITPVN